MIKDLKKGIIQGIGFILILGLFGISYAAVTSVSSGQSLTADLFNQQMVPTGAVIAFNGDRCPSGWTKANGSGDEKDIDGNLTSLDLRGEFVRGWDDGRGVDSDRSLASWQVDIFKNHTHTLARDINGGQDNNSSAVKTYNIGDQGFTTGFAGGDSGGDETRPRNIALLYCVKN